HLMKPSTEDRNEAALHSLVQTVAATWQMGEPPDSLRFLLEHPEVCAYEHLVLDLLYEEYCIREELGETLTISDFCDSFPAHRVSLRRMLVVREFFNRDVRPPLVSASE